jgi:hypothetical protein
MSTKFIADLRDQRHSKTVFGRALLAATAYGARLRSSYFIHNKYRCQNLATMTNTHGQSRTRALKYCDFGIKSSQPRVKSIYPQDIQAHKTYIAYRETTK